MTTAMKALIIVLCINISMTLFGVSVGGFDVMSKFVTIQNDTATPTNAWSLSGNGSALPTDLQNGAIGGGQSVGTGVTSTTGSIGYSFVDPIKMTFMAILMILTALFMPAYWGFALGLPLFLTLFLVLDSIIGVVALVFVIRGVPE